MQTNKFSTRSSIHDRETRNMDELYTYFQNKIGAKDF